MKIKNHYVIFLQQQQEVINIEIWNLLKGLIV